VSAEINDGGSAFPQPAKHYDDGSSSIPPNNGMTLRDWFAGQALVGHLAFPRSDLDPRQAAILSYACADAMIAARKAKS
jgi:hypothetical protein